MKQVAPLVFGFFVGMIMLLQYFVPQPPNPTNFFGDFLNSSYSTFLDWKQIVFGMTLILGVISLVRHHSTKVRRKERDWFYSLVALIGFVIMVIAPVVQGTTEEGIYGWFFDYVQAPMQATMFALLAFYVASASYRAFRARSLQAALLLTAGIIVMLGRVPLGDVIAVPVGGGDVYSLADLANFVLDVPNLAAKRGILIGVGLGVTATALKILLGIERTYLGKGA